MSSVVVVADDARSRPLRDVLARGLAAVSVLGGHMEVGQGGRGRWGGGEG